MITKNGVEHISGLARIKLNEKEKEKYTKEISSILDFIAELKKVDTESAEPLRQMLGILNVTREDNRPIRPERKLLKSIINQAPGGRGDFVKVKPVLDKKRKL